MCVLGDDWQFPDDSMRSQAHPRGRPRQAVICQSLTEGSAPSLEGGAAISEPVKEVVRRCLRVEPAERPDIDELIQALTDVIEALPDDEDIDGGPGASD